MRGALVIFAAMVVIGIILYLTDIFYYRKRHVAPAEPEGAASLPSAAEPAEKGDEAESGVCCGMHAVCEKTSLSPLTGEIVYYDDEELDRFRGRDPESYTPGETEEFRDVLMTLLPQDVAGWSRSIQVRGIMLPADVRDELLMIVGELRQGAR